MKTALRNTKFFAGQGINQRIRRKRLPAQKDIGASAEHKDCSCNRGGTGGALEAVDKKPLAGKGRDKLLQTAEILPFWKRTAIGKSFLVILPEKIIEVQKKNRYKLRIIRKYRVRFLRRGNGNHGCGNVCFPCQRKCCVFSADFYVHKSSNASYTMKGNPEEGRDANHAENLTEAEFQSSFPLPYQAIMKPSGEVRETN